MNDLIKAIDGLPKIVRFLGTLIWGILTNIYRLCRSIAKQDVLGSRFSNHFIAIRWFYYFLDY